MRACGPKPAPIPTPRSAASTGSGALRDPSTGPRVTEYGMTLHQTVEWPGMRAARKDAADAGLAGATVGLDEAKLNLIAEVKQDILRTAAGGTDGRPSSAEFGDCSGSGAHCQSPRPIRRRPSIRIGEGGCGGAQSQARDDESQECRARETRRIGHLDGGGLGDSVQGARRFPVAPGSSGPGADGVEGPVATSHSQTPGKTGGAG